MFAGQMLAVVMLLANVPDRAPSKRDEAPPSTPQEKKTDKPAEVGAKVVIEPKADANLTEIVLSEELFKSLEKKSNEHSFLPKARTMTAGIAMAASIIFLGLWISAGALRIQLRRLLHWGAPLAGLAFAFVALSGFRSDISPGPSEKYPVRETTTCVVDGRIEGPVLIRIVKDAPNDVRITIPKKAIAGIAPKPEPRKR